jgi:hypothetical protein
MRLLYVLAILGVSAAHLIADENLILLNPKFPNYALAPRFERRFTTTFTGEFLFWKYSELTSDFLRTGVGLTDTIPAVEVPVIGNGTRYLANFKYDPGFRVALASSFGAMNAYDVTARYTRFHTHGNNTFRRAEDLVGSADTVSWFFDQGVGNDIILRSEINVDLTYNWVDLLAGYKFDLDRHFYLRPFAGATGYFHDGKLENEIEFIQATAGPLFGHLTINNYIGETSVWGVGAIAGLETSWNLTRFLSLIASFDFRGIFSKLYFKANEPTHDLVNGQQLNVINFKYNLTRSGFMWDFKIGPQWDMWFGCNRYHLSLNAAWELISSTAIQMEFLNNAGSDVGMVTAMQGLTLSGLFEF